MDFLVHLINFPALMTITTPSIIAGIVAWRKRAIVTRLAVLGWVMATILTTVSHTQHFAPSAVHELMIPFFAHHCIALAIMGKAKKVGALVAWTYFSVLVADFGAEIINSNLGNSFGPVYTNVGWRGWHDLLLVIPVTTFIFIKMIESFRED